MKKIIKLSLTLTLLLAMIISMTVYSYGALSCNVNMSTSKSSYNEAEQFTVDVKLAKVKTDNGIISLGGTLEYDKDSLTLVKMTGKNGWETPTDGSSYNKSNGKIAITRNGVVKKDETVFRITFKVKKGSKKNTSIVLKDIMIADGTQPVKISKVEKKITVKSATTQKETKTNKDNSTKTTTSTNKSTKTTDTKSVKTTDKTVKKAILPHTGDNSAILIIAMVLVVLAASGIYVKIRFIDKKMK